MCNFLLTKFLSSIFFISNLITIVIFGADGKGWTVNAFVKHLRVNVVQKKSYKEENAFHLEKLAKLNGTLFDLGVLMRRRRKIKCPLTQLSGCLKSFWI